MRYKNKFCFVIILLEIRPKNVFMLKDHGYNDSFIFFTDEFVRCHMPAGIKYY